MSPHAGMRATEIVAGVHDGSFTAQEVIDGHLEQIERFDPAIQAFATLDPELTRAGAGWVDAQRWSGARLPLHGVPVAVKDIIDVAGMPTIAGFEPYRNSIATADAEIVSRLRSLGAVMLGKTHTTQFAVGDPAPTGNPWDLRKSPAGSSAGSGAAVPAGMAPVALGTQTAGSMLRPAAFNGAVGFKPTIGWMPLDGVIPLCWSLDHLGLYSGSVEDIELVYGALVRAEPPDGSQRTASPRIGLLTEYLEMSEPAVADHIRFVARRVDESGASVVETRLPVSFDDIFAVHQVIFAAEMAAVHSANLHRYPDDYGPRIRAGVETGSLIPSTSLIHARRLRQRITAHIGQFLEWFDAVLLPTVSSEACDRSETGDRRFQIPATLFGFPAISLPTGLGPAGLPLGAQLIGRSGSDARLLAVAGWIAESVPLIGRPEL